MGNLLGQVVPLALGAMVSPLLLIVQLLVLTGRNRPLLRAMAVTAGSAVTLAVITGALMTAAQGLDVARDTGPDAFSAILRFSCALLLIMLAIHGATTRRQGPGTRAHRLAQIRTGGFFVVGLVLMLTNVTSLVLYVPAIHAISQAAVTVGDKVLATAILFTFTMLPLWLPLGLAVSLGARSESVLSELSSFVTRHATSINTVICLAFAGYLIYGGIMAF